MESLRESLRTLTRKNERQQGGYERIHNGVIVLEEMMSNTYTAFTDMIARRDSEAKPLVRDTYSLLLLSNKWTSELICSLFIFIFQVTIYVILIIGFLNEFDESLPANVSYSVKVSQFAALVITLMTQDDTVYSIVCLSMLLDRAESSELFVNLMGAR